ncbi:IS4/IS5 family transposase [Sinirhodobacter populi]|uniref:IS4/IS5 family transposase n=1 Tax=Paenirhodobacter populi TaxID=2306993 RepID=A0A451GD15_9RHOB|nr:IS4/IS5 family transposase [Sinirhodobacter populi]
MAFHDHACPCPLPHDELEDSQRSADRSHRCQPDPVECQHGRTGFASSGCGRVIHDDANDAARDGRTSGKFKKLCRTDPDATMATSSKAQLRPACKQHTAVDDLAGVVVDVEIVTGEEHDMDRFDERMDAIEATLGVAPARITADRLYGIGRIYAALEDRRIEAVIPPLRSPRAKAAQGFPTERFKFDPHHDVVR